MSSEKQFLQLHLQNALLQWRERVEKWCVEEQSGEERKVLMTKRMEKTNGMEQFLLTALNESGLCEFEGNHVDSE